MHQVSRTHMLVAAAAAAAGLAAGSLISLMSSKDSEQVEEEAVPANKEVTVSHNLDSR